MPLQPPPITEPPLGLGGPRFSQRWLDWFRDAASTVQAGSAPTAAGYLVTAANADLPSSFNLGALSSGFLFITVAAGTATPSSTLSGALLTNIQGPQVAHSVVSKTFADTGYVALIDQTVLVDATGGATTINLPASPTSGKCFIVKKTDASANAVTVNGNGNNIDGAATQALAAQWNSFMIQGNGTAYFITAQL